MADESITDEDQICLHRWLEKTYEPTDPSRGLSFEAWQFQVPNWRFFFGSLESPDVGYAVAVHERRALTGEAGLAEFVKDKDVYNHPDALPLDKLAGIAMFFLSFYGKGDAMLITDPVKQGEPWAEKLRRLLHEPRLTTGDDGHVLQFWYLQRMLIRITLYIRPNNEISHDEKMIVELLPPE